MSDVVDSQLALWGVIGICAIIIVALGAFTVIAVVFLREKPDEIHECIEIILGSELALQLLAVSAIVVALLFLGIAGRLTEGAIAILGSVGGYVLGNLSKGARSSATKESATKESKSAAKVANGAAKRAAAAL